MVIRLMVAAFLVAHAAIHLAFVVPAPEPAAGGPSWPFSTETSWLVTRHGVGPEAVRRAVLALVFVTIASFASASLAVIGVAPAALWIPSLVAGSLASLAILSVSLHPWLAVGVAIDLALLWIGLVAGWPPAAAGLEG